MPPFFTWGFPATGASTNRTMPDRLSEVKNVLDFGAVPGTDSTTAIQNAVNAALAEGGGTVFIPAGTYTISSPGITFNTDADFALTIRGVGAATFLNGAFSGYVIDRHLGTPHNTFGPRVIENMRVTNTVGGAIRLGSTICGAVRNCNLAGHTNSFTSEDVAGTSSQCITIDNCVITQGGTAAFNNGQNGICLGGTGVITGCDLTGNDTCLRLYGGGIAVLGCRMESSNWGLKLGIDSTDVDRGLHGFVLNGMPMEGMMTFCDFIGTVTGFLIGPQDMTGHDSSNCGAPGGVNNSQYGMRMRANKAYAGEVIALAPQSWFDVGGIYIEDYTTRAFVTFSSCMPNVTGGTGVIWRIPTATSGFKFLENNIDATINAPSGTRYLYANLPGSGVRFEGDEYDISDASTTTLGATVSQGTTGRCRVRWNGSAWICIGP